MPKEDVSFPYFHYKDLVKEEWDTSTLRYFLERRYFLVIYQEDSTNSIRLKKVMFWTMPYKDLETDAKLEWEETIDRIKNGKADALPKKSETRIIHVRPHARDASDTDETPDGKKIVKKSFWLNASYLKEQIISMGE